MLKQRVVDLTPPKKEQLNEFRRLMGMNRLFEDTLEPADVEDEQLDPEEQMDPDDAKDRDKAEADRRIVKDTVTKKEVYDGVRNKESSKKTLK